MNRTNSFAMDVIARMYCNQAGEHSVGQHNTHSASTVQVNPKFNNLVDQVEVNFNFRKVTDEVTGNDFKRPTVKLNIPRPSVEGIKAILENGDSPEGSKALELLLEAVQSVQETRARQILSDSTGESLTAETFPFDELDFTKIANLPKSDRREAAIPKEVWDDFVRDYISIMPALANKTVAKVALAAKVFTKRFNIGDVKTDKVALKLLRDQLSIYISNTTRQEEFVDLVDMLDKKAEGYINAEPENILSAL